MSRHTTQMTEPVEARAPVHHAVPAGASIEEIGDAAGLDSPAVEQILRDRADAAEST